MPNLRYSMILASFLLFTKVFSQTSLPYYQNFDGVAEASYDTDTDTLNELNEWGFAAARDDSERLGGLLTISSTNGFEGSQSVELSRNTEHNNSQFVTNSAVLTLDLSGYDANTTDIFLDFSFTRGNFSYSNSNNVRIKGSPSDNNLVIYDWDNNLPDYLEWESVKRLNLSQALRNSGQNFSDSTQIRFVERSYSQSHGFYFDEVTIYERPDNDVRITEIGLPSPSGSLSSSEEFSVSIVNEGVDDLTSVPFTIKVEGPGGIETISETASMSAVSTSESYTYTFSHLFDLSVEGEYFVTAYSSLSGDMSYFNDTISSVTYKFETYSSGLPYTEDFEIDNGGFIAFGTNISWEYGYLSDGSKGWITNAAGNYNNNETSYLNSPVFDLSAETSDPYIGFDIDFNTETCCDEVWLEVSLDGGETFSKVISPRMQYVSYADYWNGVGSLSFRELIIPETGGNSEVLIRIAFSSDASFVRSGIEVDNFSVRSRPANDVALTSVSLPPASATLTSTESISLEVVNLGASDQSSVPLSVVLTGPSGVQTISESTTAISSGDTITYIFSQQFDFSEVGSYSVTAYTSLATDVFHELDTISDMKTYKQSVYTGSLPLYYSFDDIADTTIAEGSGYFGDQSLNGLSYVASYANGQLTINSTYAEEGKSLILSRSEYRPQTTSNQLVISMDLSVYSAAEDKVMFDYDVREYYESNSNVGVYVRGNESDPWVLLHQWNLNSTFNGVWQKNQALDISEVLVANSQEYSITSQIKIQSSGYSELPYEYLSLDNIRVYAEPVNELQMYSVSVSEGPFYSNSETVQLEIINKGTATQSSVPVRVIVDGPTGSSSINETLSGTINQNDTVSFNITEKVDMSLPGLYQISGYLELENDEWRGNDSVSVEVGRYSKYTGELPYYLTFEGLADTTYARGQYTMDGLNGISFEGSTSKSRLSILDANYYYGTGSRALKFDRRDYTYSSNEMVLSLDLSDLDDTQDRLLLDFQIYSYSADDYDADKIYVRGNSADDWLVVYDWFDTTSYYSNQWISILELPLIDTLKANGQTYSNETQIKFSEYGYGTSSVLFDNIKVYLQYDTDIAIVGTDLEGKSAALKSSQTFSVEIFNNSISEVSGYDINVSITGPSGTQDFSEKLDVPIPSMDTMSVALSTPLQFDEFGDYTVSISVSLTDDGDPTNDDLELGLYRINSYSGELPIFEDFESLPDSLYENSVPSIGVDGFSFNTDNENGEFEIYTPTSGSNLTKVAYLSRGNLFNYTNNSLILSVDLSENITQELQLDFDFASHYNYRDGAAVYVRGNESDSWLLLYDLDANKPSNLAWKSVKGLGISDTLAVHNQELSESFQIRFKDYEYDDKDGYFFDNIKLYPVLEQDVELISLVIPEPGSNPTESEVVTIQFMNKGVLPLTEVPLTLIVSGPDGVQEISETSTESINRGDTTTFEFTSTVDFSAGGEYSIQAFASVNGDTYNEGDTLEASFFRNFSFTSPLPIEVDFESDSAKFRTYGNNTSWVYDSLKNDTKGWLTKRSDNYGYQNNEDSYLHFPTLDLSEIPQGVYIDFDLNIDLESCCDYAWLEVSTDGVNFEKVVNTDLLYNDEGIYWTGTKEVNVRSLYIEEIQGQSNVILRLALSSDGSVRNDGVQFDNLLIRGPYEFDLTVVEVGGIEISPSLTASETIRMKLVNEGTSTLTSSDLSLEVISPSGDTVRIAQSVTFNLASFDTLAIEFEQTVDLSQKGDYQLFAYVETAGEQNFDNDSIYGYVYHQNVLKPDLPYTVETGSSYILWSRKTTGEIDELDGFSFKTVRGGILSTSYESLAHPSALSIYNNAPGSTQSEAILTLDLADKSVSSNDLLIVLDCYFPNSISGTGLFVRGNHTDEWIQVTDLTNELTYSWNNYRITLSDILSQNDQEFSATSQLKFSLEGGYYQSFIDNISIFERRLYDMEVLNLTLPESGFSISNDDQIDVVLRNNGSITQTSIPTKMIILGPGGENVSNATSNVTLVSDAVDTISLSYGNAFTQEGTYQVTVSTTLAADTVSDNNSSVGYVMRQSVYTGGLPFYESFADFSDSTFNHSRGIVGNESGLAYLAAKNIGRLKVGDINNVSSAKMYRTDYDRSSDNQFVLTLDMAAHDSTESIQLDFSYRAYDYQDSEYNNVLVRGDTSDNWVALYNWQENADDKNFQSVKYLALADTLAANGQQFSNMTQIRIVQSGNGSECFFELASLAVYEAPDTDIAVESVNPIAPSIGHNSSELTVTLINNGTSSITSVPLTAIATATDGSTEAISFTPTINLLSRQDTTITLDSFFNIEAAGNYEVEVFAELASDQLSFNNSSSTNVITRSVYSEALPLLWRFDDHILSSSSNSSYQFGELSGLSYSIDGQAKIEVAESENGNKALRLSHSGLNYNATAIEMVLSVDLSQYDTLDDVIRFRFDVVSRNYYPYVTLYVRANEDADWVRYNDLYASSFNINLQSYFKDSGHQYSDQVQIKFQYSDNGYSTANIVLDNFYLYNEADNMAPQSLSLVEEPLPIYEDIYAKQYIGKIIGVDEDEFFNLRYNIYYDSYENSQNNSAFYLNQDSLFMTQNKSYEADSVLNLNIRVTDTEGAYLDQAFEFVLVDVNDTLTGLGLSKYWVNENNTDTVAVATLQPVDEDLYDTYTYEFITSDQGTDNERFVVENDQLMIIQPNYEVDKHLFEVHLMVTEASGDTASLATTIEIYDVNEPPISMDIILEEIDEDVEYGSLVATFSATDEDPGDETFIYRFEKDSFYILDDKLYTGMYFDIDDDLHVPLTVIAEDEWGARSEFDFEVIIIDLVELGIEDESILVYPNPTMDELHVENKRITKLEAFDLTGIKVVETEKDRVLDTSNWKSGVYILRIWVGEESKDVKIIKK